MAGGIIEQKVQKPWTRTWEMKDQEIARRIDVGKASRFALAYRACKLIWNPFNSYKTSEAPDLRLVIIVIIMIMNASFSFHRTSNPTPLTLLSSHIKLHWGWMMFEARCIKEFITLNESHKFTVPSSICNNKNIERVSLRYKSTEISVQELLDYNIICLFIVLV